MTLVNYDDKKGKGIISGDYLSEIREYFSAPNEAAKFNRSFFVPKRLYAITPNGQFDIGLYDEINIFLKQRFNSELKLSEDAQKQINPKLDKNLIKRLNLDLRDYQEEAVNKCLDYGRGLILLGTGGGKTLTIATLIDNFYLYSKNLNNFKTLILVPDLGLVNQTYDDFIQYNVSFSVSKWTGKINLDKSTNVVIANLDIVRNKFEQNPWIKDIDLLVIDEAHKFNRSNKCSKLLEKIKTPNKFGFTGTLPEDNLDKWNVIGKIGPILIQKSSSELREEKYLTNASIKILKLVYKNPIKKNSNLLDPTENYRNELQYLTFNPFRNKVIEKSCCNFNNNILILINNIDHGQHLFDLLTKELKNKQVFFIRGEIDVDERDKVKAIIEKNDNVVCIAISSIFSTGVNIKNLHMIIFASGGKSFIRTVQSIGRGLRLNENKEKLIILDIADSLEYGLEHSQKRKAIYDNEKIEYSQHIIKET
jgi:superfamily II DNA or RNA helicase